VATNHNPENKPRALSCDDWETMLADALDGTLSPADAAAFEAHSQSCKAGCAELLDEAKRGREWLRFLHPTPEAPEGLLEKILAGTAGSADAAMPLVGEGATALPRQPWLGVSVGLLQRHSAESRILMTLAMAFFSVALTLNLAGVRLNQIRLSDLTPSSIASAVSRQYYSTSGALTRHYMNLRIVYELESRMNEMRRGSNETPSPQPQKQPETSGKPAGAARRSGESAAPAWRNPERLTHQMPAPVLAVYRFPRVFSLGPVILTSTLRISAKDERGGEGPGNQNKTSERSLA
jgi:hypothetical protein